MRVFYAIILGTCCIITYMVGYKRTKDIFSPLCFFSFLHFLRYVPHLLYTDYESFTDLNDSTLFATFLINLLFLMAVVVGYIIKDKSVEKRISNSNDSNTTFRVTTFSLYYIVPLFLIGILSRIFIIANSGGFIYVFNNMGSAYTEYAQNSSGYFLAIGNFMAISESMIIQNQSVHHKKINIVILVCMCILGMGSFFIFSSRSPALEMLMIVFLSYHFMIRKFTLKDFLSTKTLILTFAFLSVVSILPILRNDTKRDSLDFTELNISEVYSSFFDKVFSEFSIVGRDTFVYHHFNISNYWLGKNYLNLLVAPIPHEFYPNKPALDDGNYLCNIIYGYEVDPNAGREELDVRYSIPFSTPGISYANFGIIGVLFSGFLIGCLYRFFYKKLLDHPNSFNTITYQLVIYQLELSTLSLMQTLIPFCILMISFLFVRFLKVERTFDFTKNIRNNTQ